MAKFRKRPVVVEAVQLRWDTWTKMCEFTGVGKLTDGKPEGCYVDVEGRVTDNGLLIASDTKQRLSPLSRPSEKRVHKSPIATISRRGVSRRRFVPEGFKNERLRSNGCRTRPPARLRSP